MYPVNHKNHFLLKKTQSSFQTCVLYLFMLLLSYVRFSLKICNKEKREEIRKGACIVSQLCVDCSTFRKTKTLITVYRFTETFTTFPNNFMFLNLMLSYLSSVPVQINCKCNHVLVLSIL